MHYKPARPARRFFAFLQNLVAHQQALVLERRTPRSPWKVNCSLKTAPLAVTITWYARGPLVYAPAFLQAASVGHDHPDRGQHSGLFDSKRFPQWSAHPKLFSAKR